MFDDSPPADQPPASKPGTHPLSPPKPRLPMTMILIGLGILFVVGIGIAWWLINRQDQAQVMRTLDELVLFEEQASEAGEVETVLALQDPGDPGWRQARSAQVAQGLSNALPLPGLTPLPATLEILNTERIGDTQAIVTVRRQYATTGGEQYNFDLGQFYQLEDDIGWVRTGPWPVFWQSIGVWQSDLLQIVYYAPDEGVVERVAPFVDSAILRACEVWVRCPADQPVNLLITNDPAVFKDDPADNPRVVANLSDYGTEAIAGDLEYAWIASPQLSGIPIDTAGEQLLGNSWAIRAIATRAEQLADEDNPASELFYQAIEALDLGDADPGMTFASPPVVVIEVTQPPTPTVGPTNTPEFETYVVQSGDTVVGIAERNGITVELLLAFNNIPRPEALYVGQEIVIPHPDAIPPTATPLPTATNTPPPTPTATPIPPGTIITITVSEGAALEGIAARYNTTVEAIVAENNLANADSIYVGQELRIPYGLAITPQP